MALTIITRRSNERLATTLVPGKSTQIVRLGPLALLAGDHLACHARAEVTTNQRDGQNVLVWDQLFIHRDPDAIAPARDADIVGGPFAGFNVTNLTPAQHHLVLQVDEHLTVASPDSYYLIYIINWDGDPGIVAGTVENIVTVEADIMRGVRSPAVALRYS